MLNRDSFHLRAPQAHHFDYSAAEVDCRRLTAGSDRNEQHLAALRHHLALNRVGGAYGFPDLFVAE